MAITTSKDFKIGPSTTELRGVSKFPRTLNNPVLSGEPCTNKYLQMIVSPFIVVVTLLVETITNVTNMRLPSTLGTSQEQWLWLEPILGMAVRSLGVWSWQGALMWIISSQVSKQLMMDKCLGPCQIYQVVGILILAWSSWMMTQFSHVGDMPQRLWHLFSQRRQICGVGK